MGGSSPLYASAALRAPARFIASEIVTAFVAPTFSNSSIGVVWPEAIFSFPSSAVLPVPRDQDNTGKHNRTRNKDREQSRSDGVFWNGAAHHRHRHENANEGDSDEDERHTAFHRDLPIGVTLRHWRNRVRSLRFG